MVLRSSKNLYCIADKGETVDPDDTFVGKAQADPAPGSQGGGGPGGNGRFDPPLSIS